MFNCDLVVSNSFIDFARIAICSLIAETGRVIKSPNYSDFSANSFSRSPAKDHDVFEGFPNLYRESLSEGDVPLN